MSLSVLVFCSSSNKVSPMFFSEMSVLGKELAKAGHKLIYGGARVGLMGAIADAALKEGGHVIGVIPENLDQPGTVHESLTEKIVVSDLLDRKKKMLSMADVVVAAPGGMGTLDEITEVLALKQLQEHDRPVVFMNFMNFWKPFLECFEILIQQNMISQNSEELYDVRDSAEETIKYLSSGIVRGH